ncbi:MAG: ABC transporter substrate-binding protein [Patescibacteria group bacterium]
MPDLAASYALSKDEKTYTLKLKEGVRWHDGEPFNAEDVVFTISTVQNPEYNSPLRTSWQGVKIETSDKNTVILTLKTPYGAFIENLALLGILPKHVWSKVIPQNFPLADFNLKPIGTGPYRFVKLQKDSLGRIISVNLTANSDYFSPPLIKNLVFKFYLSEEEAVSAFNRKEVDGLLLQTAQNKNQLRGLSSSSVFSLPSLRVYALFLNTDDPILKDQNVRLAINYAVNREELLNKLLDNEGKIAVGPIPPGTPGSSPDIYGYDFDPKKAQEILEKAGWVKNEHGIYTKKLNKKDKEATSLKLTIVTAKSIQLITVLIRDYLKNIGIEADLKIVSLGELQQNYLRTKNYSAILIGESYTGSIDPYVFWHGAAIKDPGLNLSLYNNRKVNKILEDARQITDPVKRAQKLEGFQKLVLGDAPAVFLYSPNYIYVVKNTIKNINLFNLAIPSNRFSKINEWYIDTGRVWH